MKLTVHVWYRVPADPHTHHHVSVDLAPSLPTFALLEGYDIRVDGDPIIRQSFGIGGPAIWSPPHPCRVLPTRSCPASYGGVCGDRPCARYESDDETPWLEELGLTPTTTQEGTSMDQEQQRDHAEEAANQRAAELEYTEEEAAAAEEARTPMIAAKVKPPAGARPGAPARTAEDLAVVAEVGREVAQAVGLVDAPDDGSEVGPEFDPREPLMPPAPVHAVVTEVGPEGLLAVTYPDPWIGDPDDDALADDEPDPYVMVRGLDSGLFVGVLVLRDGNTVTLEQARQLTPDVGDVDYRDAAGWASLALGGPLGTDELAAPVTVTLLDAIQIIDVTDEARAKFEAVPNWGE